MSYRAPPAASTWLRMSFGSSLKYENQLWTALSSRSGRRPQLPDRLPGRMEPVHERLHQQHTLGLAGLDHPLGLRRVRRERLLAQHVLAGPGRGDRPLRVEVVGQRVVHGIDVRIGQQVLVRAERARDAEPGRGGLGTAQITRGDRDDLTPRGRGRGRDDLLDPDLGRREDAPPQHVAAHPHESSVTGRNAISRIRWFLGRVSTNSTASATSSADIIPASSGISGVRPRPIANSVATPPGTRSRTGCPAVGARGPGRA